MTFAIIGSGALGSNIVRQFARIGTTVAIANATGPESLQALARELGPQIHPTPIEEARLADVVILATPFEAASSALNGACD